MEWDIEKRRKLAGLVKNLSWRIQDEELKNARTRRLSFSEVIENTDRRVLERLEPLGFQRANRDWVHESGEEPTIFQQSATHLWFDTTQGRIVKVSKDDAEKVLVLGFL